MAKTRLIDITNQIKSYFAPSASGVHAVGGARVRDVSRELPGEFFRQASEMGKSLARSPIRVGGSLAEIPFVLAGKEPFKPLDVPILGKTSTYARQAVDETKAAGGSKLGTTAAILKAGSQAIGDVAFLGNLAQAGARTFAPKKLAEEELFVQGAETTIPEDPALFVDQTGNALASQDPADMAINNWVDTFENQAPDLIEQGIAGSQEEIYKHTIDNTVAQLRANGLEDVASNIERIDLSRVENFEELRGIMLETASSITGNGVQEIPIDKIVDRGFGEGTPDLIKHRLDYYAKNNIPLPTNDYTIGKEIKLPITVQANPDGTYSMIDGNHRLVQQIINKGKSIMALVK